MSKVKICGITNKKDALSASKYGADYIGFIFYKESLRHVTLGQARGIAQAISGSVKKVGVFVNEKPADIVSAIEVAGLDIAQLHSVVGEETYEELKKTGIPYLRVLRIKDNLPEDDIKTDKNCYGYLLDSYDEIAYGGTGKRFNWKIVKQFSKSQKVFLSGGLNENNVCEAIQTVNPYAVDVSSGIEGFAGKKNTARMEIFIRNAKECTQT